MERITAATKGRPRHRTASKGPRLRGYLRQNDKSLPSATIVSTAPATHVREVGGKRIRVQTTTTLRIASNRKGRRMNDRVHERRGLTSCGWTASLMVRFDGAHPVRVGLTRFERVDTRKPHLRTAGSREGTAMLVCGSGSVPAPVRLRSREPRAYCVGTRRAV